MQQSPRHLMAVSLFVAALFLAMSAIVRGAPANELLLPLVLFVLGIAFTVWPWMEERTGQQPLVETPTAVPEMGVRTWDMPDVLSLQTPTTEPLYPMPNDNRPVDEPEVPLEAIVEPTPMIEAVEPDDLPPETAILEYVQTEEPPETITVENVQQMELPAESKPAIAIVDVEPEAAMPTEPLIARQPVAEIEAAAEKVAADIKDNADQIQAMLKTESAARKVEVHAGDETSPVAVAIASAEEDFVDTQERSDAAASWVGEDDAMQSPGDPGENINLTDEPNPFVEGFPTQEQSEFSGMAETAAIEREKRAPSAQPDDLTVIEGIGLKMAAALKDAGIDTFARLAQASEGELRLAIQAAGMRLAPTLPTWSEQAAYAERGDWDGLKAFQRGFSTRRRERS